MALLAREGVNYASTCYYRAVHEDLDVLEPDFRSETPGHDYIEIDLDASDKDT